MQQTNRHDSEMTTGRPAEVFAWAMYDWANSAYSTLSITILFSYLTTVVFLPDDTWGPTVWAWGISLSMLIAAVVSPVLGALADANCNKRTWLACTALPGAVVVVILALVPPDRTWLIVALFVTATFFFEISLGFYNGFLPEIADEQTINRVSAWGYALGYLGGALALLLALSVIAYAEQLGLPTYADKAAPVVPLRIGVLIMGLWWALFTLPTLWILRDRGRRPQQRLPAIQAVGQAVGEVGRTLRNVRRYKMLALFLLAFLFYNDGMQTVISQSSTFATKTPALSFDTDQLILLVLMIQFLALPGALLVGLLADRVGQKPTLMICLGIWIGLVVAARFVTSPGQFWILGAILALVLGGTQSVSRAIMGVMTPPKHTAEFFGFFNLSGKATSFLGTFLFGLIFKLTNDPPMAVLSLLVFFLLGWVIVARVNIEQGRRQALRE
jgi:UMF1 family MFS transporter